MCFCKTLTKNVFQQNLSSTAFFLRRPALWSRVGCMVQPSGQFMALWWGLNGTKSDLSNLKGLLTNFVKHHSYLYRAHNWIAIYIHTDLLCTLLRTDQTNYQYNQKIPSWNFFNFVNTPFKRTGLRFKVALVEK